MRGMFSYAMMLIVNPILILFYQNCSMLPVPQGEVSPPAMEERGPAAAEAAMPSHAERSQHSCSRGYSCAMNVE